MILREYRRGVSGRVTLVYCAGKLTVITLSIKKKEEPCQWSVRPIDRYASPDSALAIIDATMPSDDDDMRVIYIYIRSHLRARDVVNIRHGHR